MSADQVEPVEKKTESPAGDAGASDAQASEDAQPSAEQEATTASDNLREDSGISGTTQTDSSEAGADNNATDTVVEEAAEAEAGKLQTDSDLSDPTNLEQLRKMDPSQLTDAQRRALGLPTLAFLEGADMARGLRGRTIDLDGRTSVREGENRTTNDAVIKIDGVELARFDDADTFEGQLEADIKVTLPENAVTRDIEGVGKYSIIEGEDGSKTEIIQADDGSVLIKQGEEFIKMSTGYWGVVTEGADAKESFEAMSEKIEADPASSQSVNVASTATMSAEDARLARKLDQADAGLMLPAMAVTEGVDSATDGVRDISLDGRVSVGKDETRKSNDAVIKHNGKTIVEFDDADIIENQWDAKIKVELPENAQTKNVDGVGSHSILEGNDGVPTEVLQAQNGEVFIRTGNEYVHMTTGFNGQVIEGAEAKAAFESEAAKYNLGAKAYDIDMRLDTKGTVRGSDGSELVNIGQDGNVTTNIPDGAYVNQSGNNKYAMLKDGTEMIVTDSGTTIRNTDGSLISVSQDGQVSKSSDASTWDNLVNDFQSGDSNLAQANDVITADFDYDSYLYDEMFDLGSWYPDDYSSPLITASGGDFLLDPNYATMDSSELFIELGAFAGSGGDLSLLGPEIYQTKFDPADMNIDNYVENSFKVADDLFTNYGDVYKTFEGEDKSGLLENIESKLPSDIPGEGTKIERIDAMLAHQFEGVERKPITLKDGSTGWSQVDEATGIKRIESSDGNVILEIPSENGESIKVTREKGASGDITSDVWNFGKDANGQQQILRREGPDTWSGHMDGVVVSHENGAHMISALGVDFDQSGVGGDQRQSFRTRDRNGAGDGDGNLLTYGRRGKDGQPGQPARFDFNGETYTIDPATGKPVNANGEIVESGQGLDYTFNDKGRIEIETENGKWIIGKFRGKFVGADGTEHCAGENDGDTTAAGTDEPATRRNPNFKDGEEPPVYERERRTAGDGERPVIRLGDNGEIINSTGDSVALDPDSGDLVWKDAQGNVTGTININTGDGQIGDFKFENGGVQDLSSGIGILGNGDIYDFNRGSTIYSSETGYSSSYQFADAGYNSPAAVAERKAAQGKAADASGKSSLANASVKGFASVGDLGNILSALGGVADALNTSSGALAQAMSSGDAFAISVARSALSEALSANSICQQAIGMAKRFETIAGPAAGDSVTMSYIIKKGTAGGGGSVNSAEYLAAHIKASHGDFQNAAVRNIFSEEEIEQMQA